MNSAQRASKIWSSAQGKLGVARNALIRLVRKVFHAHTFDPKMAKSGKRAPLEVHPSTKNF
jgi:hypothetical protein